MHNRRYFLKQTGMLALGSLALPRLARAANPFAARPIGIQMFTVMRHLGEEPKKIFQQLADMGFKEIETAFSPGGYYYGMKPKELASMIEGMGMKWRGHHVMGAPFRPRPAAPPAAAGSPPATTPAPQPPRDPSMQKMMQVVSQLPTLKSNMQQLVDEAAEGGVPYLVCASSPVGTLDEIKATIDVFNKTGEACKKAGLQFAYHNHATEFDAIEGKRPYDLIMSQTDKDLVKMELDLAWAIKAKQDPVALFKEYPGRFPLWHVKDIAADREKITEVGNGIVDFKAAFAAADVAGMKHFFYEQDLVASMDSVKTSYQAIAKIVS